MSPLLLALLLAGTPKPPPLHAQQVLREQCLLLASDPKNPWAMAHAIKLFGPSFLASDGRRALDVIMGDYLLKAPQPDGTTYHFRAFGPPPDALPIEPHLNLNTKALLTEAHLPLSTGFTASFGKVSLKELVESAKRGFRTRTQERRVLARRRVDARHLRGDREAGATWKTNDGQTIALDQVFDDALTELERATADIKAGMEHGEPQVEKRKQGVYAHPCGTTTSFKQCLGGPRTPRFESAGASASTPR